jgi:hypothetical protein
MATTIEWFGKSSAAMSLTPRVTLPISAADPYRRHDFQTEDLRPHHLLGHVAGTPEHPAQIPQHRRCHGGGLHFHLPCAFRPVSERLDAFYQLFMVCLDGRVTEIFRLCSLPGADRIAIKTGAVVVGNGEAINVLRAAGVPESQLVPVSGGERIPLFSSTLRQAAVRGEVECAPGPPGAPPVPDTRFAVASVHVWPSLHCLMPGSSHADVPDVMDTGKVRS